MVIYTLDTLTSVHVPRVDFAVLNFTVLVVLIRYPLGFSWVFPILLSIF